MLMTKLIDISKTIILVFLMLPKLCNLQNQDNQYDWNTGFTLNYNHTVVFLAKDYTFAQRFVKLKGIYDSWIIFSTKPYFQWVQNP